MRISDWSSDVCSSDLFRMRKCSLQLLATWGILRPGPNARAISRAQAHRLLGSGKTATDDDGQLLVSSEPPFVKMPRRPANWLDGEISLRMEKLEADFLREHVARVRPTDRAEPSFIARLARLEMVPHGKGSCRE